MAITDIRDDLRQECEKFGVVKKILIFDVSYFCCQAGKVYLTICIMILRVLP